MDGEVEQYSGPAPTRPSAVAEYLQRHPLKGSQPEDSENFVHVRRRYSAVKEDDSLPRARERKSLLATQTDARDLERAQRVGRDLETLSDQIHSTLLLRMVGATFPTSLRFAALMLLLINAAILIVSRQTDVGYLLLAVSATAQFLLLPFLTAAFVQHTPSFSSPFNRCLSRLLSSPISCLAVWMQARVYVAFTACIFAAFKLTIGVGDMAAVAVIGITLLCLDVAEGRYLCNWSKILMEGSRKKRMWARDGLLIIGSVCFLTLFIDFGARQASPASLSLMRLITALVLTPSPSLGLALVQDPKREARLLTRFVFITVAVFWIQQWRDRSQADTEKAILSRCIATPGDLLLAMNSSSSTDQLITHAHILSATQKAPEPLPVTNSVVFIESDVGLQERGAPVSTMLRSTIIIPRRGPVGLHFGQSAHTRLGEGMHTSQDRGFFKNIGSLPYRVCHLMSAWIVPILSAEVKSSLAVMISQSAGESVLPSLLLYCLTPEIFNGKTPNLFTPEQIRILAGVSRPSFVSAFTTQHQLVLSPEAATLTFGDQLFPSLTSRQEMLVTALQQLFFVTEMIHVTPPTGSFLPRSSKSANPKKEMENVFRYDHSVRTELCRCLADLQPDFSNTCPIFKQLGSDTKSGKWLIFGDGSIGLMKDDRQALLSACQELLAATIPQFLMAAESVLNISKVLQQVAPLNSSAPSPLDRSGPSEQQPWGNLKKYYPSAELDTASSARGPQATKLTTIIARSIPIRDMARDFAMIPSNPPYSIAIPQLANLASQLCHYLDRWTTAMASLLNLHDVPAERLVHTRAEVRRLLAKR